MLPQISLIAPTLLALLILALGILSLRPPEGFRGRFDSHFRAKTRADRVCQFYDAFSGQQPKPTPVLVARPPRANNRRTPRRIKLTAGVSKY